MSISELIRATGKVRNTVKANLVKMQRYGLAEWRGGGWVRGPAALDEVAKEFNTEQAATRRRKQIEGERRYFALRQSRERDHK